MGASLFTQAPFTSAAKPRVSNPVLSGPRLGETEQSRYVRAKAAVSKYDDLSDRLTKITDQTYQDQVSARVQGSATDPTSPISVRNAVADLVTEAEGFTPTNYLVFTSQSTQDLISNLEDFDSTFEAAVTKGEESNGAVAPPSKSPAPLSGPSLGLNTGSVVCGAAGLVIVGTIVYFALK